MKRLVSTLLSLALAATVAVAQDEVSTSLFQDDGFFMPLPQKAPWLLDWGATVSPAALFERRGAPDSLPVGLSASLWARLTLPGSWLLYARVRDSAVLTILPSAAAGTSLVNLWEINAAYLQSTIPEAGLTLSIGRKPFLLGSGLVLSGYGDGLEFQVAASGVSVKGLGFYTGLVNPGFSPFGMGAWDDAHGARRYIGAYSVGASVYGQELSVLGLYQGDFGLDAAALYTSWYTGLQAKGLALGGDYLLEWFLEDGRGPSGSASAAIDAFGGTCRYRIVLEAPSSPSVTVQYSLASGDPDRTSAEGSAGNASGADTAFQAFGQVNTGSALRPSFSNIHVAHLGFSLNPLGGASLAVRSSSVGLGYFYYAKYDRQGAVDVEGATLAEFDLGHGLELNAKWSPFNDLSVYLNAGVFLPGMAFPAGETMRFSFSGGASLSF